MAPPEVTDKRQAAREVIDILHEIATLLVSGSKNNFSVQAQRLIFSITEYWPQPAATIILCVTD